MSSRSMEDLLDTLMRKVTNLERRLVKAGGGSKAPVEQMPAGAIIEWPLSTAPPNWVMCHGQILNRVEHASLFAQIGTTFGAGNGTTTFNAPNFRGRTPFGWSPNDSLFGDIGQTGGQRAVTLKASESGLPAHYHGISNIPALGSTGPTMYGHTVGGSHIFGQVAKNTNNNAAENASAAHDNMPPYIAVNFIIKSSNGDTAGDSQLTQRVSVLEERLLWPEEYRPAFEAIGTGSDAKTSPAIQTTLVLDSPTLNEGNHYNPSTGRFTAPKPGLYSFSVSITQSTSENGPEAWLYVNGSSRSRLVIAYGSAYMTSTGTVPVKLAAGDLVDVRWTNNNGRSVTLNLPRCSFSGFFIG